MDLDAIAPFMLGQQSPVAPTGPSQPSALASAIGAERTGGSLFDLALQSAFAEAKLITQAAPPAAPIAPAALPLTGATPAPPPGGYPNLDGDLDGSPELLGRLNALAASRGEHWHITSGLRTDAEQAKLWANRDSNPFPVAAPGTSVHRTGEAADVTVGGRPIQAVVPADVLRAAGLKPLSGDAVHVELA